MATSVASIWKTWAITNNSLSGLIQNKKAASNMKQPFYFELVDPDNQTMKHYD